METASHHCINIVNKGIIRYIPKTLADCDAYEFNEFCGLVFQWQNGNLGFEEFRVQVAYRLLKLKAGKRKVNKIELEIMHANIYMISQLIDTFFNIDEKQYQIKQNFTHNHNESVRPIFTKLYGPKGEFTNTTFGQYEDALNLFHLYHKHQDVKLLYMLMATYYWPKGHKYDADKVERRANQFKHLHFGTVYGFFLFFGSFQIYLTDSIITWEGNKIDLSILFKSVGNPSSFKSDIPGRGMKSLGYQLAESGVFGDLTKLRHQNLWEVLLRLYDLRKRDLDYKAEEEQRKLNKR